MALIKIFRRENAGKRIQFYAYVKLRDRKKDFEISKKNCSLFYKVSGMVKTVFENSKFLMFKIVHKNFCLYILMQGSKFSEISKNFLRSLNFTIEKNENPASKFCYRINTN